MPLEYPIHLPLRDMPQKNYKIVSFFPTQTLQPAPSSQTPEKTPEPAIPVRINLDQLPTTPIPILNLGTLPI